MTHQSRNDLLSAAAKNIAANSPPQFITRLRKLAGADVTATLVAEFGGSTVYLPRAASATSANEFDVALEELHVAYRNHMADVMRGVLATASQDIHLEWLAVAQKLVERRASVLDFVERQRALCPPQSTQS